MCTRVWRHGRPPTNKVVVFLMTLSMRRAELSYIKKFTQAVRMTTFNNTQNQQYIWQQLVPVGQVSREQRHKSNKVKSWGPSDVGEIPLRQCKPPCSLLYRSRKAAYLDFEERWSAGQVIHHGTQYGAWMIVFYMSIAPVQHWWYDAMAHPRPAGGALQFK